MNGKPITDPSQLFHRDVFTIIDRSFRFEFPPGSPYRTSPEQHPMKIPSVKSPSKGSPLQSKLLTPKSKPPISPSKEGKSPTRKRTPKTPLSPHRSQSLEPKVLTPKAKPPVLGDMQSTSRGRKKSLSSPDTSSEGQQLIFGQGEPHVKRLSSGRKVSEYIYAT